MSLKWKAERSGRVFVKELRLVPQSPCQYWLSHAPVPCKLMLRVIWPRRTCQSQHTHTLTHTHTQRGFGKLCYKSCGRTMPRHTCQNDWKRPGVALCGFKTAHTSNRIRVKLQRPAHRDALHTTAECKGVVCLPDIGHSAGNKSRHHSRVACFRHSAIHSAGLSALIGITRGVL